MLRTIIQVLLAIALVVLIGAMIAGVVIGINIAKAVSQPPVVQQPPVSNPIVQNPVTAPNSDCQKQAEQIGAPKEVVSAICDTAPTGNGVSTRLTAGTKVEFGTITFDAEDRVWILQDFTVPPMANYAFEYAGAQRAILEAPFVVGSELGWAKDGSRVPFKICFNVEGECTPPANLFPTN